MSWIYFWRTKSNVSDQLGQLGRLASSASDADVPLRARASDCRATVGIDALAAADRRHRRPLRRRCVVTDDDLWRSGARQVLMQPSRHLHDSIKQIPQSDPNDMDQELVWDHTHPWSFVTLLGSYEPLDPMNPLRSCIRFTIRRWIRRHPIYYPARRKGQIPPLLGIRSLCIHNGVRHRHKTFITLLDNDISSDHRVKIGTFLLFENGVSSVTSWHSFLLQMVVNLIHPPNIQAICKPRMWKKNPHSQKNARSEFFCGLREKSPYARPNPTRPNPTPWRFWETYLYLWNGLTDSRAVFFFRCHHSINFVFDRHRYPPVSATARGMSLSVNYIW